ncbi:hypothetical protein PR048_032030 [Dryococelus australis]|uniref:Uncharacterized protein n=1 Tax=Dryococelus australis TaxID=614101 RepID=A0ABQ9G6Y6_9NEOP|nr:hypothetical protein PR048_032030 [Dryococelus australis]
MDRHEYMWNEIADMHRAYGAALGNATEARRIFHERNPNRTLPSLQMSVNIDQRLCDSGSLSTNTRDTGLPRQLQMPQFEEEVLDVFEETLLPAHGM